MADPRADRVLLASLSLPIVALALLVLRAEITSQGGRPYVVHVTGYDPRDLLRGHYLRYRLDFRWDEPRETCTEATCCYCLRGPAGSEPTARKMNCGEASSCDAWFPEARLQNLEEFYIPEDRGPVLEHAIRNKDAKLAVRVSRDGDVVIQDLLLDGIPWRDAVK